jgi:hypothetical protein
MLMFVFCRKFSWYSVTPEVRALQAREQFNPARAMYRESTNSMQQSASWENDSLSGGQQITRLLWKNGFTAVFTKAHQWTLRWATFIQSTTSRPVSISYIFLPTSFLRKIRRLLWSPYYHTCMHACPLSCFESIKWIFTKSGLNVMPLEAIPTLYSLNSCNQ